MISRQAYGIPACASPINNAIVREEWQWGGGLHGDEGWFVSDCGAVGGIGGR